MSVAVSLSVFVCLFVPVRNHIPGGTARPIFTKFSVHVTYGRSSVHFWLGCDMLCTSGFMDDVIVFHDGPAKACRYTVAATPSQDPCPLTPLLRRIGCDGGRRSIVQVGAESGAAMHQCLVDHQTQLLINAHTAAASHTFCSFIWTVTDVIITSYVDSYRDIDSYVTILPSLPT